MTEEVLDTSLTSDIQINVKDRIASRGKRFLNMFIDSFVVFMILLPIVGFFLSFLFRAYPDEVLNSPTWVKALILFPIMTLFPTYYVLMEKLTGKTVGKYLTKTRVAKENGAKPSLLNLVGRTLARYIPFNAFSLLVSSNVIGWHDSLSKIYVIDDKA